MRACGRDPGIASASSRVGDAVLTALAAAGSGPSTIPMNSASAISGDRLSNGLRACAHDLVVGPGTSDGAALTREESL